TRSVSNILPDSFLGEYYAFNIVISAWYSDSNYYFDCDTAITHALKILRKQKENSMATATATKKKPETKKTSKAVEAIKLLRADHRLVNGLFEEYENTTSVKKKRELVAQICTELTVHAQIEEEIFYPAVKQALKDKELIPEATVEHNTLKQLIAEVEGKEPDGEMFDARIKVMSEYVKHHVKEEQTEIFPKAKTTKLDMEELGALLMERKEELLAQRL